MWIFSALIGQSPLLAAQIARFGINIPMQDGVQLSADAWMPPDPGRHPALLVRTPYGKTNNFNGENLESLGPFFAAHGYVYVLEDVRGRGDSQGNFNFFFQEGRDGFDSVEWIAQQSWSNGKVGMLGLSYMGTAQWLAAREKPPHLVCIAPTTPAGRYFEELPYVGGAFQLEWALHWLNGVSGHSNQEASESLLNWKDIYAHRPLLTMDEAMGRPMRLYREFLEHDTLDEYWKKIVFTPDTFRELNLPTLTTTGWFDGIQPGSLFYWQGMQNFSSARERQYLIVGPWTHNETFFGGQKRVGLLEFSDASSIDNRTIQLAFFDHFLKESDTPFDEPKVKLYVTGSNTWRSFSRYPPAEVATRNLYLHSTGNANTIRGDGALSWAPPLKDEEPDRYVYDPKDPIASDSEGKRLGMDQRATEQRSDVLVYSSDVLNKPVEIIGPVTVHLSAASDALDTDFVAKLIDVYPDGSALNLGPRGLGIVRARYRHGSNKIELLTPGKPESFQILLFDIGHTFLPGHRIRVEVESSAFPYANPNQNTGNPVATDTEWKVAHQAIFHDTARMSYVSLPVMPTL